MVELVVTVHLHTTLQRQTPTGMLRRLDVAMPTGSTLGELLARLEIRASTDSILFVINGRQAELTQPLLERDEVHLIPALSGG